MKRFNGEKIIQSLENLKKSYFKDLSREELEKINEIEDIVKNGKIKNYFSFFHRNQEELLNKRIGILGRSCEILYEILRGARAYQEGREFEIKKAEIEKIII